MSVYIDNKSISCETSVDMHHIPCEIVYNGKANVSNFFKTTISNSTEKIIDSESDGKATSKCYC